jgi:hypothetical protein
MAPDHRDPQLAQALAAHHGPDARLKRRAPPAANASAEAPLTSITSTSRTATFRNSHVEKQEPVGGLTASCAVNPPGFRFSSSAVAERGSSRR